MSLNALNEHSPEAAGFYHEAYLYEGEQGFLDGMVPFLRDGAESDAAMLVAVSARKIELLTEALGDHARAVRFVDMTEIGRNPAWIIPAWHDFVAEHAGSRRPLRGIGEPIWASRTPPEMVECQRHEALLNVAFDDADDFQLVCPYDTTSLSAPVLEEALATHPVFNNAGSVLASDLYPGVDAIARPFDRPLPPPGEPARTLTFGRRDLPEVREHTARHACDLGFDEGRVNDAVLSVSELATNAVRHGGGGGCLRSWHEDGYLVVEVTDTGVIDDPLAGRRRPQLDQEGGYGLWMVNRLSHLVQIRVLESGNVVRAYLGQR